MINSRPMMTQPAEIPPAFESPSRDGSVAVMLGAGGEFLDLRLQEGAYRKVSSAGQLAARIMMLNALGRLSAQVADGTRSRSELAEFERQIDF